MTQTFCRLILLVSLACGQGCAAYHIGNHGLFSSQVQTVGISICQNETWRRGYGEQLAYALKREIENRTPYMVVPASRADTVLEIKIVSERKNVTFQNEWADPRELAMDMVVQARWLDRRTQELRQSQNIDLDSTPMQISAGANMVAEAGQSNATTTQKMMETLAQRVVGMMETTW